MISHIIVVFTILSLLIVPNNAVNPITCDGYNEPRVFVDSQAWWVQTPGKDGKDFGHVHTSMCFPFHQKLNGIVPFDVRIIMHENPGKLVGLTLQIGSSGQYIAAKRTFSPALMCFSDCEWWFHLDANTVSFSNDGWQEFRFRPKIQEPDGNILVGSTSYQAYLNNGKPVSNYRPEDYIQMKAWYTDINYAQSRLTAGYTYGIPVKGQWVIKFACDASSKPVTGCLVTIDPDFHNNNNGIVLFSKNVGYNGTLSIDTTKLTNGVHKLVIRSSVNDINRGSTLSSVAGLPFVINN
jgi:hypothetical protein